MRLVFHSLSGPTYSTTSVTLRLFKGTRLVQYSTVPFWGLQLPMFRYIHWFIYSVGLDCNEEEEEKEEEEEIIIKRFQLDNVCMYKLLVSPIISNITRQTRQWCSKSAFLALFFYNSVTLVYLECTWRRQITNRNTARVSNGGSSQQSVRVQLSYLSLSLSPLKASHISLYTSWETRTHTVAYLPCALSVSNWH